MSERVDLEQELDDVAGRDVRRPHVDHEVEGPSHFRTPVEAGIEHADLITVKTRHRRLPTPNYIEAAIRYLDGDIIPMDEQSLDKVSD